MFLTYVTRGNKAVILTMITLVLTVISSVILFVSPDTSSGRDDRVEGGLGAGNGGVFSPTPVPTTTSNPGIPTPGSDSPMPVRTATPAAWPPTMAPSRVPILTTNAPIPATTVPPNTGLALYPFATVYECDWKGQRVTTTTKTASKSVVRLCIEAPPLRWSQVPTDAVVIEGISWFVFTRQEQKNNAPALNPLTQHAVTNGLPDPFGRTLINCPSGTPQCNIATSLRPSFFEEDAFLHGRGEMLLKFVQNNTLAGISPVNIVFLLSSEEKPQPLQLGRAASKDKTEGYL